MNLEIYSGTNRPIVTIKINSIEALKEALNAFKILFNREARIEVFLSDGSFKHVIYDPTLGTYKGYCFDGLKNTAQGMPPKTMQIKSRYIYFDEDTERRFAITGEAQFYLH